MRSFLIGLKHGKEAWQFIAGPEVSTADQLVLREQLMKGHPVNDTWSNIEIHQENHIKGRLKFVTTEQAADGVAKAKQSDLDISNTRTEAEKRERDRSEAATADAAKAHAAEIAKINQVIADAQKSSFPKPSDRVSKIVAQAAKAMKEQDEKTEATTA